MEHIIAKLEEKENGNRLAQKYEEDVLELAFLTEFFNSFNLDSPIDIAKIDRKDFILAYLCTIERKERFSILKEKVDKFDNINNITDCTLLQEIFNKLLDKENNNIIIKKRPKTKKDENNSSQNNIPNYSKDGKEERIFTESAKLAGLISTTNEGQDSFFELIEVYPVSLASAIIRVIKLISISECIAFESEETRNKKVFLTFLTEKFGNMYKVFNDIKERKEKLEKEKKENLKKKKNLDKKWVTLKNKIRELNKKGIVNIDCFLLNMVDDPEIENDILLYSLKHNMELYKPIEEEAEKEKQLSELEKMFKNSHFDFSFLEQKQIDYLTKYGQIDKISKIFEILSDDCFHFINSPNFPICEILILSNPSIVSNIRKLYIQGFLSNKIIINNPEIFVSNISPKIEDMTLSMKAKYESLVFNVDILRSHKIDVKAISKANELALLEDSNILKENLEIFEPYNLNYSRGKRLPLLCHKEFVRYLDLFIELGLSDYIKENPDLINSRSNILINRIRICKCLIGINYFNNCKLSSIVTSEDFKIMNMSISDDDLFNYYIENSTSMYENSDISKILDSSKLEIPSRNEDPLKEYKVDDNTYNIHGILISRNKFLRNYSILEKANFEDKEKIFNALIHGSILTFDELDILESAIKYKDTKKALTIKPPKFN